MRCLLLVAGAVAACAGVSQAQPRFGPGEAGPQSVFYEAVALPSDTDTLRGRVDIHFRIDREYFVPVKKTESELRAPFIRRGELLVEMIDSAGSVAGRALHRIELGEENADRKPAGREWHEGVLSLSVPPGTYKIQMTVDDLESRRNFTEHVRSVKVAPPASAGLETASTLFVLPLSRPDSTLPPVIVPMNYGGELLFGRPSMLAIIWHHSVADDSTLTAKYSLTQLPASEEDAPLLPASKEQALRVYRGVTLEPSSDGAKTSYSLRPNGSASLVLLPFPSEKLLLRAFSATISLSGGRAKRELTKPFRAIWPDMPSSLKDIDYALEALKYILTEGQLDSLRTGNLEMRRKNLESFWRGKDTTPETTFNEVQTEYYRRVDHAMRTFGTLRQPDGSRSDRGRIFILYGPPTRTERSLDPAAGYKEVWGYDRLNKKFTFIDRNKAGEYLLISNTP